MIGEALNRVCDIFDKPSKKPVPPYVVARVASVIEVGFWVVVVTGVTPVVLMLWHLGVVTAVFWFLVPIQTGFWATVWAFVWHWSLILLYAIFVVSGYLSPKEPEC